MPSTLLGNPLLSGAQIVYSGNLWSGQPAQPVGGIQFRLSPDASGYAYLGCSGSLTMKSGGFLLSGGGLNDGMVLGPGDSYFVPKIKFGASGQLTVWAWHDAAASGQARLYWEPM